MVRIHLPGVMSVGVNEATQDVVVKYVPGKTLPANVLKGLKDAGYLSTPVVPERN